MGLLWGIVKTVVLVMAAIIAILFAIDALLLHNLFRKGDT
jgi:preprotein translocase subunit SecE